MFNEVLDSYKKKFIPRSVDEEKVDPVFTAFLHKVAKNLTEDKEREDEYNTNTGDVENVANISYVDELKSIDKVSSVQSSIKESPSVKEIVAEQIKEYNGNYNMQFPNHLFSEAGGGDNEYFHNGGTMKGSLIVKGDLDVSGKYLSNGVEINLGTGSGATDRLTSNSNSFILNTNGTFNIPNNILSLQDTEVFNIESRNTALTAYTRMTLSPAGFFAYDGNSNSITFDSTENDIILTSKDTHEWRFNSEGILQGPNNILTVPQLCSLGRILSGNQDLADIFLTTGNVANWDAAYTNVSTNSAFYATTNFVNNTFLPLTGGTITGATRVNGDVTIFGNLSSTGTQTFANTVFTTTSALSVINVGIGPALVVHQTGTGDIASFYDTDQNLEVLHVGGENSLYPNVGVRTSAPNKSLTVKGELSASGDIWTSGRILSGGVDIGTALSYSTIVQVFTATGVCIIPPGAKSVKIQLYGAGSGGGSGSRGAAGTIRVAGGGGGGGGIFETLINTTLLSATELVTVGIGGIGGQARVVDQTGQPGTTGGDTIFSYFRATGGRAGTTYDATGTAGSMTGGAGVAANAAGTVGGNASPGSASTSTSTYSRGGASGGGLTASNTTSNGGIGGFATVANLGGGAAGTISVNGGNGQDLPPGVFTCGSGGGGGASSITTNAGNGGNGGFPAGGGGGGGVGQGFNSGGGGKGADGVAILTFYF